ncbi:unnamed protein product [Peniophora sp. CBMAI 1063]|nr:unnamed protein product [Peniophora sp. CBMAI 1063]
MVQQQLSSAPDPEGCLRQPTHEEAILYHHVWRALLQSSPDRAALPPEIVSYIVVLAGWILPDHSRKMETSERAYIKCYDGDESAKVSKRWFATEPLTVRDINGIAALRLITGSKDQGWTSLSPPASFSWFEVAVEREGKPVSQLQWKSHHNSFTEWRVGDVVSVWLYAQSYAWSNEAEKGAILFYKWFEPVIPLRQSGQQ